MFPIRKQNVQLQVADGTAMAAYVSRPEEAGPYPGILIFQEAFGVNAHIRDVTQRFAREGYVSIAPELFHRTAPGFEGRYDDFESARTHISQLKEEGLLADLRSAYDWLRSDAGARTDSIASVGFCMGGRVSFLADALLPLRAAISFYGAGIAPGLLGRVPDLHAPILMFWGGLDKNIGPDQIRMVLDALRGAGKVYENMEFSHAGHGFFCDARASYSPSAAEQAWVLSLAFLKKYLRDSIR